STVASMKPVLNPAWRVALGLRSLEYYDSRRRCKPGSRAMVQASLSGVKACVFDAYGTLFDFAAAAQGCGDLIGESADRLTGLWREKQLQYTWLRGLQGRHADFW